MKLIVCANLFIGTSKGLLKIYDLRDGKANEVLILSTSSSSRKLKGIRFDPFNDNSVATFQDIALEPVKIWDM